MRKLMKNDTDRAGNFDMKTVMHTAMKSDMERAGKYVNRSAIEVKPT